MENQTEIKEASYQRLQEEVKKQMEAKAAAEGTPAPTEPAAVELEDDELEKIKQSKELQDLIAGKKPEGEEETEEERLAREAQEQEEEQERLKKEEAEKAKQNEKKNWRELLQETPEFKAKQQQEENEKLLAKMNELKEFEDSEVYKIFQKAKQENKNPLDLVKELVVIDVDKMSDEDLVAYEGKKHGLTEDELNEEIRALENRSPLERKKYLNGIREQLKTDNEALKKKFEPARAPEPKPIPEEVKLKAKESENKLGEILDNLHGKKYLGVDFTPSRLKQIEDKVYKLVNTDPEDYMDKNGTLNMAKAVEHAIQLKFNSIIVSDAERRGKEAGKFEMAKNKHNPSKDGYGSVRAPLNGKNEKEIIDQKVEATLDQMNPNRVAQRSATGK